MNDPVAPGQQLENVVQGPYRPCFFAANLLLELSLGEGRIMRSVEIEPGLKLRFPGQDVGFVLGVEIGTLASAMSAGVRELNRTIARENLEQARELAMALGYRLTAGPASGDGVHIRLQSSALRPVLKIIK